MADDRGPESNNKTDVVAVEAGLVKESSPADNCSLYQTESNNNTVTQTCGPVGGFIGTTPSGWADFTNQMNYLQNLSKPVKQRIKALKKLQFETSKIEADFYRELHQIECNFAQRYSKFYELRRDIVNGMLEPTDEECDWPHDELLNEDPNPGQGNLEALTAVANNQTPVAPNSLTPPDKKESDVDDKANKPPPPPPTPIDESQIRGIPFFWLTVIKNVDMLAEMTHEQDEPILKHLTDIRCTLKDNDPSIFTLEFVFEENEYFNNAVLTKEYTLKTEPDREEAFSYEGPEIVRCKGCTIDWKAGKNVTVRTTRKKMKHKGSGKTMVVTKTEEADSFFNFFNPPPQPDDGTEMDECSEDILTADFEIGHFIRERIIPRAVLYFTGEAADESYDRDDEQPEEEEDDDEYDDDDDDDEDDDDQDYDPSDPRNKQDCKTQ